MVGLGKLGVVFGVVIVVIGVGIGIGKIGGFVMEVIVC